MSKRPFTSSGPVPVSKGPQGILSFYQGQTLEHEQTGARVLVLQVLEGGQKALLFPLDEPGRIPFEANASWAVGWDETLLDGPRMVELHRKGEPEALWAAYVPVFAAACDLWRYYEGLDGRPFVLVIHAQHGSEYQFLESIGYFREEKD